MPEPAALEAMLFAGVRGHLERIVTPTLALELNIARLRDRLHGDTPEERFDYYAKMLARREYVEELAAEYPMLFQLAEDRLALWVAVSIELIGRIAADWQDIVETFFRGESPGALDSLRFPQRSTKRGGRAVILLSFSSGARLVYKPRSLAVEARFQELLDWLGDSGFQPAFQRVKLLDRDSHGWMEWIDPEGCASAAEIQRFYRRQGAYLALFYALEATDLHMSNVIAAGEHPALIDLETLFHPRDAVPDWPALDLLLDDTAYYSVMRSGLLPEPETAEAGEPDRLDLSGLAGAGGQRTPYEVPMWRNLGTDAMRLERERKIIGGGKNRPSLDGKAVDALDFLDALESGFTDTYRLLAERRAELLANNSPLARFAGAEVRVLPRSGRRYGSILENSYHPDLMRDPFLVALDKYYWVPTVIVAAALLAIGGPTMVLWGIFLKTVMGWHFTWLVNSATHLWGTRRFETRDDSRNNGLIAAVTWGEGWHNNHHAYPRSAKHGLRWYEVDINWITILALRKVGLIKNVYAFSIESKEDVQVDMSPIQEPA